MTPSERKEAIELAKIHALPMYNGDANKLARALLAEVEAREKAEKQCFVLSNQLEFAKSVARDIGDARDLCRKQRDAARARIESLQGELQLQQIHYSDKLKEVKGMWADKITALQAERDQALADCAAKDEVLRAIQKYDDMASVGRALYFKLREKIDKALSHSPGADLLSRLRKAEEENKNAAALVARYRAESEHHKKSRDSLAARLEKAMRVVESAKHMWKGPDFKRDFEVALAELDEKRGEE